MTLYTYDGHSPVLPESGDVWIAPGTQSSCLYVKML